MTAKKALSYMRYDKDLNDSRKYLRVFQGLPENNPGLKEGTI